MKTIYLCGAINGCTDDEATTWREAAKLALAGHYHFLDPMRRDYRGKELDHAAEIIDGDIADIDASDILLVNAERPSWGTAMEVFYAHLAGKAVVAITGASRVSPWLMGHSTVRFPRLEDAAVYLKAA